MFTMEIEDGKPSLIKSVKMSWYYSRKAKFTYLRVLINYIETEHVRFIHDKDVEPRPPPCQIKW